MLNRQPNPQQPTAVPARYVSKPVKSLDWSKRLEPGKKLGQGHYGRVLLVRDKYTHKRFALKSVSKKYLIDNQITECFKDEVENMARLHHPNIIKIYGWFHSVNSAHIVMEYAPKGELFSILNKEGPFSSERASKYVYQVTKALEYCHQHMVIHRDLKPENLLMGADGLIKLGDFGSSTVVKINQMRRTWCGTLDYIAPEMVNHKPYDFKVDNWALGVLAFEFLTLRAVFNSGEDAKTSQNIIEVKLWFPDLFDLDAKNFISALLVENPSRRMSLQECTKHRWITKFS